MDINISEEEMLKEMKQEVRDRYIEKNKMTGDEFDALDNRYGILDYFGRNSDYFDFYGTDGVVEMLSEHIKELCN